MQQPLTPPAALPGRSAAALLYRSVGEICLGFMGVIPEALQSLLPRGDRAPWAVAWLVLCLPLVSVATWYGLASFSVDGKENERGYTTIMKTANERPELFLLQRNTFAVLSAPYQVRPQTLGMPFKQQ